MRPDTKTDVRHSLLVLFTSMKKKAGATSGLLWKLIFASVVMLVTGYWGEAIDQAHSWQWGLASGIAYFYIVYLVWMGDVAKLAGATSPAVAQAVKTLGWFVLVGWAIYPIGYMCMPGGWLNTSLGWGSSNVDLFYNIADAINKIGFGLVVYNLAISSSKEANA